MKTLILAVLALTLSVGNAFALAAQPPVITTNEFGMQITNYPSSPFGDVKVSLRREIPPPTFTERYHEWCYEAYGSYVYWSQIALGCFILYILVVRLCRQRKCSLKI